MRDSAEHRSDANVTAQDEAAVLTVPEVARKLRLSERQVWSMVKSGELRSYKLGASRGSPRRIPVEEIPAYIERKIAETNAA